MIVISKTFSLPQHYTLQSIAPLKDIVFIDIETTGFTPATSSVYLIGAVYHQQMEWHIRQWFSDSLSSEQEILQDFLRFLEGFQVIVSYNGESFDIPYLQKCADAYGIEHSEIFTRLKSFDLYQKLKGLRKILPLENMKLPSLERFLGISRSDLSNGGDLIPVYQSYLDTHDETLYLALLSHNENDLKTLPQLLPMLAYNNIFKSDWSLAGYSMNRTSASLTLVIDCSEKVPVSVTIHKPQFTISIRANQMILEIKALVGSLRYFFENAREYYYLPEEDRAIHKKVAQFVDPEHRVQATAATCYTNKEGLFIPLSHEDMFDIYKADYTADQIYTEYIEDEEFLLAYAHNLLSDLVIS